MEKPSTDAAAIAAAIESAATHAGKTIASSIEAAGATVGYQLGGAVAAGLTQIAEAITNASTIIAANIALSRESKEWAVWGMLPRGKKQQVVVYKTDVLPRP